MSCHRLALRTTFFAALAFLLQGQGTPDLNLTLSTKAGQKQFQIGEQIDLELRFTSTQPGRYQILSTGIDRRYVRDPEMDSFIAEPATGARDPLADSGTIMGHGNWRMFGSMPISPAGQMVPAILNDWVSFRKPGRYRISAKSNRVVGPGPNPVSIPLQSNAIEIEIVPADASASLRRLNDAIAILERPSIHAEALSGAGRTLRYLETAEAVPALVRFSLAGQGPAEQDIRAGLMASPHRDLVIAQMGQALVSPETAISGYWLGTLSQIEYARRFGPRGAAMPKEDMEAMKRWSEEDRVNYGERFRPIHDLYMAKLADALTKKRGPARAVSLETLLSPGSPQIKKVIASEFATLPDEVQHRLLMRWHEFGDASLVPALARIAEGSGSARDPALERLLQLDPAAARRIILARIERNDLGDPRGTQPIVFLFLPDSRLPQLDQALVQALRQHQGMLAPALIARYASDSILPQVLEYLEKNPSIICHTAIVAYLYRVDPASADRLREKNGNCPLHLPQQATYLLMSPGLERAAIRDLAQPDWSTRRAAQTILQYGGSASAEQALWDGFRKLPENPATPLSDGIETGYVDALVQGFGWVLSGEKLDLLVQACRTTQCRDFATSQRRFWDRPVLISIMTSPSWQVRVGGSSAFSWSQMIEKIRQFPRGTAFRLEGHEGKEEVAKILSDEGMAASAPR